MVVCKNSKGLELRGKKEKQKNVSNGFWFYSWAEPDSET